MGSTCGLVVGCTNRRRASQGELGGGAGWGPGREVAFASCTPGANSGAQRSRDPVISEPQQRGERSSGTVSVVESVLISPPPERLLPAVPSRGGPQPCQRLQSKISPMCVALRDFRGIMAGTRASPSTCPGLSCKQMSCTRILRRARCWRRARRAWLGSERVVYWLLQTGRLDQRRAL